VLLGALVERKLVQFSQQQLGASPLWQRLSLLFRNIPQVQ